MSVFIIAEAGVNHNGSIQFAKQLIDVAIEAGVDAVKFQTFKAENLVSKNAQKANYQKQTTDASESQFDMIKKLELDIGAHQELIDYCQGKNIIFLSTPFDHDSIDMLNDLIVFGFFHSSSIQLLEFILCSPPTPNANST